MKPARQHRRTHEGKWEVAVTPPRESGFNCTSLVVLSQDQFDRYCQWLDKGNMIQNLLPELSPEQREQLISGITPTAWHKAFGDNGHD
jgi:hypothetical protein